MIDAINNIPSFHERTVIETTGVVESESDDNSSLLDMINESAQQVAISSVLLAASVAWADGVVQLNEKYIVCMYW